MDKPKASPTLDETIKASWERCELQHGLLRSTTKPVLRLQTSELRPRLEDVVDRTGGRLGIFSELSKLGTDAGHCLVLTDADGVVVRFESQSFLRDAFEEKGIALGSCWDERTAGTNGVSMAMLSDDAVTVRGEEHFHRSLTPFACTAVRILDADNTTIGAVSLSALDRGSPSDYLIAKNLLLAAVGRVQSRLFESKFADHMIVSVTPSDQNTLLRRRGLVAVDEAGVILGATSRALELTGTNSGQDISGQRFDAIFGVDADVLGDIPDRVLSLNTDRSRSLNFTVQHPDDRSKDGPKRVSGFEFTQTTAPTHKARRRALTLHDVSRGSVEMARNCARVEAHIRRATPVVIEGESGTGKSAIVLALKQTLGLSHAQVTTIDCATITDTQEARDYIQGVYDQARVVQTIGSDDNSPTVLVFDNVNELPGFAQPGLRSLLAEIENDVPPLDMQRVDPGLRIVAISRNKLLDAVKAGGFREDLYYLLAGAIVTLPPLRHREGLFEIAQFVGEQIAGTGIEITDEAFDMLSAHDWPGNVRELRNVLRQTLIEGSGRRISPMELTAVSNLLQKGHPPISIISDTPAPNAVGRGAVYDEKTMLMDALTRTHWNVTKAARYLGMGRATINRKIKKHGLSRPV